MLTWRDRSLPWVAAVGAIAFAIGGNVAGMLFAIVLTFVQLRVNRLEATVQWLNGEGE